MIKLNEVVTQLNSNTYNNIKDDLIKNKANKFLFILDSFRENSVKEEDIFNKLNISHNSFYVLKSRLYDRIQNKLSCEINVSKNDIYQQLEGINHVCYTLPNEIAIAYLLKLENDLITLEMHSELLLVYSALKKMHYNTKKHFHYSQLYNKSAALWLSIEKANDILSTFNSELAKFHFSKSLEHLEKLMFTRNEVNDHLALNPSKQIRIIKNIIDIQLFLFCNIPLSPEDDIEDLLKETLNKINQLPESCAQKKWDSVIYFLSFEHYNNSKQQHKTHEFFIKTNNVQNHLLLYSNVSLVAKFLTSKINYIKSVPNSMKDFEPEMLSNSCMHSKVQLGIYQAMLMYYSGDYKKGINMLNELLTNYSFKDYFHVYMEIKFTMAYMYLKLNDYTMAESLISGIYKKIKLNNLTQYSNALYLIKFFKSYKSNKASKILQTKRQELLVLFFSKNHNNNTLLEHLSTEIKKMSTKSAIHI
jgi:hypothetical protein